MALPPDEAGLEDGWEKGCYSNGRWLEGGCAPWVPADHEPVLAALEAMGPRPGELLLDLGCGDGRICRAAAERFGCRALGVELDAMMAERAREVVADMPGDCRGLVEIRQANFLEMVWDELPAHVTMYLLPEYYQKMEPLLERFASSGASVVVFGWALKGSRWESRKVQEGPKWWMYQASPAEVAAARGRGGSRPPAAQVTLQAARSPSPQGPHGCLSWLRGVCGR